MLIGDNMSTGAITLEQIHQDILILHKEINDVKKEIEGLRDIELEVQPEYIEKLKKIKSGKFLSRQELEKELEE